MEAGGEFEPLVFPADEPIPRAASVRDHVDVRADLLIADEPDRCDTGDRRTRRATGAIDLQGLQVEWKDHFPGRQLLHRPEADYLAGRVEHNRIEDETGVRVAPNQAAERQHP